MKASLNPNSLNEPIVIDDEDDVQIIEALPLDTGNWLSNDAKSNKVQSAIA